jgi:hypothetical protein
MTKNGQWDLVGVQNSDQRRWLFSDGSVGVLFVDLVNGMNKIRWLPE